MARLDEEKALAVLLYLAEKAGGQIDLYKLLKMIYFADKAHLHKWGRTITADKYCRMNHGVTPSAVYDMIKSVRGDGEWIRDLSPFFELVRPKGGEQKPTILKALQKPDLDELSQSDIETLDQIFDQNIDRSFDELKMKAHDKVYDCDTSFWINDEDLAEGDPVVLEQILVHEECERFARVW